MEVQVTVLCKCRVYGIIHYETAVLVSTNEKFLKYRKSCNSACICKGLTADSEFTNFGGLIGPV